MFAAVDPGRKRLTAEDFLEWLEPGTLADLIDGEAVMRSPVSIRHALLFNFLDRLLGVYVDRHRIGFLYRGVVAVRLDPRNVFQPGLAFYRAAHSGLIRDNHVEGAPDLVVEVLSPRTVGSSPGSKFSAYERHGVLEYWGLDPEHHAHRFYRRDGELLVEYAAGAAKIESRAVPGFFVMREWLDPQRLPPLTESLALIERRQE